MSDDPSLRPGSGPENLDLSANENTPVQRLWRWAVGAPRSLQERGLFHSLALAAFLAWVGLGADGLSSSAYGPEEAFRTLGEHRYLAVPLAVMMAGTVFLISAAYSRIIEVFPHGGGGYVVATKLLGERIGVVSGSALLVDYVLTITISIAASGDAIFSLLPLGWQTWKMPFQLGTLALLTLLNLRGVKESVKVLVPIFLVFLVSHVVLILTAIGSHAGMLPETAGEITTGFRSGMGLLGAGGMLVLLLHAYSLGGGTYTGIEAVSNGLAIMREPKVQTARRTMMLMALSLAFTATGLLVSYLLWDVAPVEGRTLNAVLTEKVVEGWPMARTLLIVTLASEGLLLVVAAQAGFLDGPRVLANMAVDSWMPHRFSALSDRLTTGNGILLMGAAALAALIYTGGKVSHLVVMYSINVFLTFTLSLLAMSRHWMGRREDPMRARRLALFLSALALCATILVITVIEKFSHGGWVTLVVTAVVIILCHAIRRHYRAVSSALTRLYSQLTDLPAVGRKPADFEPGRPTAAVLVGGYGGVGIHTTLNALRTFPGYFHNLVFLSVGVIDSGRFKGEEAVEELRRESQSTVDQYVEMARRLGMPAQGHIALGTDAVDEAERLCLKVAADLPRVTFFAGKVIFQREKWYQRLLHNETAFMIQKRLQWSGQTMVVLPAKVS